MMRSKNIILLVVVAFIGGIVFFFICKHIYDSKVAILKEQAKNAFILALDQELKNRHIEGPLISTIPVSESMIKAELPDSVYITNATGKHRYRLDPVKHLMNVTNNVDLRSLHTHIFGKYPLSVDSLNIHWRDYLMKSKVSYPSALLVSVTDAKGNVKLLNSLQDKWCNPSNVVFTLYVGYACEIEAVGYLQYSVWNIMYLEIMFYLLLYAALVFGVYKFCMIVWRKLSEMRQKKIIEVPVVAIVREVSDTPVRSYLLHENIIFYAEQKRIDANGIEKKLPFQACMLLELFLQNKEGEYILEDDFISENLWSDGSGNIERVRKAVGRLRSILCELDSSIDIKRGIETYQLLL